MLEKSLPLIIVLNVLLQVWAMMAVGRARAKTGIKAPAMVGHPDFERAVRVHMNTIEQSMLFLPSLWLCSSYWSATVAVILGLVWIIGRVLFAVGYYQAAEKRGSGFVIAFSATALLLLFGIAGVVKNMF